MGVSQTLVPLRQGIIPQKKSLAKILVIDDEADTILLLRGILEREGYEVFGAANGLEALKRAKSIQPSLIISDMA